MHGGKRNGSGRKSGSKTKKSAEIAKKAAEEGITPLEFMLNIMRNGKPAEDSTQEEQKIFHSLRFEAAKAAAPFVHPRLAAVELSGDPQNPVRFVVEK